MTETLAPPVTTPFKDPFDAFEDPQLQQFARSLRQYFGQEMTSRDLVRIANLWFKNALGNGTMSLTTLYDYVQVVVNTYLLDKARRNGLFNPTDRQTLADSYRYLEHLTKCLPTHTTHDWDKLDYQQFSTPPHYAFVAAWAACLQPGDIFLEPSVGLGGLATFVAPWVEQTLLNELEEERNRMLVQMKCWHQAPLHLDAGQLHLFEKHLLGEDDEKPSVIVMNPPFTMDQGRKDSMTAARHIESALKVLRPGGRLVAIVQGGIDWGEASTRHDTGMALRAPQYAEWWQEIKSQYCVTANVGVEGATYRKFGTDFRTRLVVIDKTGPHRSNGETFTQVGEKGYVDSPLELLQDSQLGSFLRSRRLHLPIDAGVEAAIVADMKQAREARMPQPKFPDRLSRSTETPVDGVETPAEVAETVKVEASAPVEIIEVETEEVAQTDSLDVFHGYRPFATVQGSQPHNVTLVESNTMRMASLPVATQLVHVPRQALEAGHISAAQLESLIYAVHAHAQHVGDGERTFRRGFALGDGTGVGKGVQAAIVIAHYDYLFKQTENRRVRALWVTKEFSLAKDARRDWTFIGGDESFIFTQDKQAEQKIARQSGILVTSYTTMAMRGNPEKEASVDRLQQIIDWNPDVVVFDEAHLLSGAVSSAGTRGMKKASQRGMAGVELQESLPDARFLFWSATLATEVHNLGYCATRLGLCGPTTAFPTLSDFISKISKTGMLGMELVAADMKRMGLYLARSLSYEGTSFEMVEHPLTSDQIALYDEACWFWRQALSTVKFGFDLNETSSQGKAMAMGQFWGAAQRFYNQVLISMQTPTAIEHMLVKLREGYSVVIQLVNTNEAATQRAVGDAVSHGVSLDDLDITPRDTLIQFVSTSFPTIQYITTVDANGNEKQEILRDDRGEPIHNPEAVALKQELLMRIAEMRVPQGALDMVIERMDREGFPAGEITGRSERYILKKGEDGESHRVREIRSKRMGDGEAAEFMEDRRRVLIFSGAGNTGRSFHADKRTASAHRRRVHYVLQPGWRADEAIQGMGRTHRTNQASAPHYVLVTTDLPGQKRFVTSIARRIEQLGSLTKGNRKAANSGLFSDSDNLETKWAHQAVKEIFYGLHQRREDLERALSGDTVEDFVGFYELCDRMGFKMVDPTTGQIDQKKLPSIPQFLNRLLFCDTTLQRRLFRLFEQLHADILEKAAQDGLLDLGVEKINADKIVKKAATLVSADVETGAKTYVVELECHRRIQTVTFDEAVEGYYVGYSPGLKRQGGTFLRWVYNMNSSRVYGVWKQGFRTDDKGRVIETVRVVSHVDSRTERVEEFAKHRTREIRTDEARKFWDRELAKTPEFETSTLYMITGAILPIWHKLDYGENVRIYVAETEDGERILGRAIETRYLKATLSNLGVTAQGLHLTTAQLLHAVKVDGARVHLDGGWTLEKRNFFDGHRLCIGGTLYYRREIEGLEDCVKAEVIGQQMHFWVKQPGSDEQNEACLKRVLDRRNAVRITLKGGETHDLINEELVAAREAAKLTENVKAYAFDDLVTFHDTLMPLKTVEEITETLEAEEEALAVEAVSQPEQPEMAQPDVVVINLPMAASERLSSLLEVAKAEAAKPIPDSNRGIAKDVWTGGRKSARYVGVGQMSLF